MLLKLESNKKNYKIIKSLVKKKYQLWDILDIHHNLKKFKIEGQKKKED